MNNNEILRRIRSIFDFNHSKIISILGLAGLQALGGARRLRLGVREGRALAGSLWVFDLFNHWTQPCRLQAAV